jgi:hypothetical protein
MTAPSQQPSPQSQDVSPNESENKPAQACRPSKTYRGCSRIADYEVLNKLGEGTFGYVELILY